MTADTKARIETLLDAAAAVLRARQYEDRESDGELRALFAAAEQLTYSAEDAEFFAAQSADHDNA